VRLPWSLAMISTRSFCHTPTHESGKGKDRGWAHIRRQGRYRGETSGIGGARVACCAAVVCRGGATRRPLILGVPPEGASGTLGRQGDLCGERLLPRGPCANGFNTLSKPIPRCSQVVPKSIPIALPSRLMVAVISRLCEVDARIADGR
jgi:hypothetical protein